MNYLITGLSNGEDEQGVEYDEDTARNYVNEHDAETVVDNVVEVYDVHDERSFQRHAAFHLHVSIHQRRHHSWSEQQHHGLYTTQVLPKVRGGPA